MVKGKLIENKSFYGLRRKKLVFTILSFGMIGVVSQFYIPIWIIAIITIAFLALSYFISTNQKGLKSLTTQSIEIDKTEIRIKSNSGLITESIDLEQVDKIFVKEEYSMPQETIKDLHNELARDPNMHFIEYETNEVRKRIDFELDTHYMLNQLKKMIGVWQENHLKIEIV